MTEEFKAHYDEKGNLLIEPKIIKDGKNVTIMMPSLAIINKFKQEHEENDHTN